LLAVIAAIVRSVLAVALTAFGLAFLFFPSPRQAA
jgi:hypothetical protein